MRRVEGSDGQPVNATTRGGSLARAPTDTGLFATGSQGTPVPRTSYSETPRVAVIRTVLYGFHVDMTK
jgi:hypothetical protein